MFCCTLLCVCSSIAIILVGKRELVALLNLSSWCLVMVERLFLTVPQGCLRFVIVVFPDHTHLQFLRNTNILQFSRQFGFQSVAALTKTEIAKRVNHDQSVIMAQIHKMFVRLAKGEDREDPDLQKQSGLGLRCLSVPF